MGAAFYTCYQDCYADAIKNYISRDSHHELYVFGRELCFVIIVRYCHYV